MEDEDDDLSPTMARIALELASAVSCSALTLSMSCAMVAWRSAESPMIAAPAEDEDAVDEVGSEMAGGAAAVGEDERDGEEHLDLDTRLSSAWALNVAGPRLRSS
jgi:hypothetical protein